METEYDPAAITAVINCLSEPRDSKKVDEIATSTALPETDVKSILAVLKEEQILKHTGRGKNIQWFINRDLALPVELPEHLLGATADDSTDAEAAGSDAAEDAGIEENAPAAGLASADGSEDDGSNLEQDGDPESPGSDPLENEETAPEPPDAEATRECEAATDNDVAEGDQAVESGRGADTQTASTGVAEEEPGDEEFADADLEWTTGGPLQEPSSMGGSDLEVMMVFNCLPPHGADTSVDLPYLLRLVGTAMRSIRIVKALWLMWEHGVAEASGNWRADRGQWRQAPGATHRHLVGIHMSKAPRRVVCPDCGDDAVLQYEHGAASAVKPFDPDTPAPAGLAERAEQDAHARSPEIMFAAMLLDHGDPMDAKAIAEYTGFRLPVVLQGLWAMRACRIVECSHIRRPDGGMWRATEHTLDQAHLVRPSDSPSMLGCATCGRTLAGRQIAGGAPTEGKKKVKGEPRANTHDEGVPLPPKALRVMILAWANAAPAGWEMEAGKDPAVRTPGGLLNVLVRACQGGEMLDWLATWVENHLEDEEKVAETSEAISETDPTKRAIPRSAGAVKNALVNLTLEDGSPIERVRDARVETYRSTVKPDHDALLNREDDGFDADEEYDADDEADDWSEEADTDTDTDTDTDK
ncbi:hypothetical protein [Glycomyces sp. MUSA5-2]|uniref:hypothetical protein n=1 Tax=Glycomyces sp. MUSA5-2 TaxID=2053002 RepID=UPI003007FACF